jgi:hypothetical protein
MFKWLKKKVMPPPAPQLSELGAEIMEAMQNPGEWEADEYTLHHKQSELDLWVANKDIGHPHFCVYRLPKFVRSDSVFSEGPSEKQIRNLLTDDDRQVLAPVAYALHEALNGTLSSATLNALRLARQTESIDQ